LLEPPYGGSRHFLHASRSLDALEVLLRDAAEQHKPADEILDEALEHLAEAKRILASMGDEEGTE
jgi:hypothetical protein